MPERSSRVRNRKKKEQTSGKIYIQIILSFILICGFLMFKDIKLPNGKTPTDYARKILSTTVNIEEIIDSLNGEKAIIPATSEVVNQ